MDFIASLIRSLFLIFMLLVIAPTILFLTKSYYSHLVAQKTYVGIVELPNEIESGDDIINSVKNLFSSAEIRALILVSDGKGGNPGTCLSIHSDLIRLKNLYQKPIIAFIEKESLGGAYLIATAADQIVASPGSEIGIFEKFEAENEEEKEVNLKNDFQQQYLAVLKKYRPGIREDEISKLKSICITGLKAKELSIVDFCGGKLEAERVLRGRTVIEGKVEEVRGSLAEHFIFYISKLIHRIIDGIR